MFFGRLSEAAYKKKLISLKDASDIAGRVFSQFIGVLDPLQFSREYFVSLHTFAMNVSVRASYLLQGGTLPLQELLRHYTSELETSLNFFSGQNNSLLAFFLLQKQALKQEIYYRLFDDLDKKVIAEAIYQKRLLERLKVISQIKDNGKCSDELKKFFMEMNYRFSRLLLGIGDLKKSLRQALEFERQAQSLTQSLAEATGKQEYDTTSSCEATLTLLEKKERDFERILNELDAFRKLVTSTFSDSYMNESKAPWVSYYNSISLQNISNGYEKVKRLKAALIGVRAGYEKDDQNAIYDHASAFIKVYGWAGTEAFFDRIYPPENRITAFAGIARLKHGEKGFWSEGGDSGSLLSYEDYAERIIDVMKTGYRPSLRRLSLPIFDVTDYQNIYFFQFLHVHYGDALVSFSCWGYSIFEKSNTGESVILTKKRIDPSRQTLLLSKGLARQIGNILNGARIRYETFDLRDTKGTNI